MSGAHWGALAACALLALAACRGEPEAAPAPEAPSPPPAKEVGASAPGPDASAPPAAADPTPPPEPVGPKPADDPDEIRAILDAPIGIPALVDAVIGGAAKPEADPKAFVEALRLLEREQEPLAKLRQALVDRTRDVQKEGIAGKLPRGRAMVKGFRAAKALAPVLEAASVRFHGDAEDRLGDPLAGSEPVGVQLKTLGTLLSAGATDRLVTGRYAAAAKGYKSLARYAALIAADARTFQELSTAVGLLQEALGLLDALHRNKPELTGLDPEALTRVRRDLGVEAQKLQRVLQALRDPGQIPLWVEVAKAHPKPLWRFEALQALATQTRDQRAVEALKALASSNEQGFRLARVLLQKAGIPTDPAED